MKIIDISIIAFPLVIIILFLLNLYKVLSKKITITNYYTPFDQITGQINQGDDNTH